MASYLFIQTGHLRDTLQGLMVVQSLKRQQPGCRIVWVGQSNEASLARICPAVDVVLEFDRNGGVASFLQLVRAIRREAVETAVDLQGLLRSALLLRLSGAPERIGRRDYQEFVGLLYQRRPELPPTGARSNGLDIARYFLPALGYGPELQWPLELQVSKSFNPGLEAFRSLRRPVVLFPGAWKRSRRWTGFLELTNFILLGHPTVEVVWAGEEAIEARESWRGPRFLNLTGRTTLDAVPQVVSQAAIVVTNDNGAADLAALLNRPTLTIYGPTEQPASGPPDGGSAVHRSVRAPLAELNRLSPRDAWDALRTHPAWKSLG